MSFCVNTTEDVIRCDVCETTHIQHYCDFCHINLCKPCIGEHISDGYDRHKIVSLKHRGSTLIYPSCQIHSNKKCEILCKQCEMYLCTLCTASFKHKHHDLILLENLYITKKIDIKKEFTELNRLISSKYRTIRNTVENQIANLYGDYDKVTTAISQQGEQWHKEVDIVITTMVGKINEIKSKHSSILEKKLNEVKQKETLIQERLKVLNKLCESNAVPSVIEYTSQIGNFYQIPTSVCVSHPIFSPKTLDREQIAKSFGSIDFQSFTIETNGFILTTQEDSSRKLLDLPKVISAFSTGHKKLRNFSVYSKQEIWTNFEGGKLKCFKSGGTLTKMITTSPDVCPNDIAITSERDLVYCDGTSNAVNKMTDGHIEEQIRVPGWTPCNLCVTSTNELLVVLCNDAKTESKVVRYSGKTEKQSIQFDEERRPLYSGNSKIKYITENRNRDICVADLGYGAVVVVNQNGNCRFRYTGHLSNINKKSLFKPRGITSDSQGHILTADYYNHCVHILDQNGQFLSYIENIRDPLGLGVDHLDNLFVAEYSTGTVMVIQYLM